MSNDKSVKKSYGVNWSYGVTNHIFSNKLETTPKIFHKKVTKKRFYEVFNKIRELNDGWYPEYNNAKKLVIENKEWEKAYQIQETKEDDAWLDMPK